MGDEEPPILIERFIASATNQIPEVDPAEAPAADGLVGRDAGTLYLSGGGAWATVGGSGGGALNVVEVSGLVTIADLGSMVVVDNSSALAVLTLPEIAAADAGRGFEVWIRGDPATHSVSLLAPNAATTINGVAGLAVATWAVARPQSFKVAVRALGADAYLVDDPDVLA